MRLAGSIHATARALRRAALLALALALAFPLSTPELRAQGPGLTLGLSDADRKALAEHVLTLEDLRKLSAASRKFAELAERDRKICELIRQEREAPDSPGDLSIAARVKVLEADPAARTALEAGGFSAREYVVTTLALMTTMMDQMMRMRGQSNADRVEVNPANRQFMASHHEEVMKLFSSIPNPCG